MPCRHKWESIGGCSENPGVYDNGNGGMEYVSECNKCGLQKREGRDYTNCRPGNTWGPRYYNQAGKRCKSTGEVMA